MQYRTVPRNGDRLSVLGFGCMRYPMVGDRIDETRARAQIRLAIDKGVNYVDTAWPYHAGESERVLGEALRDGYREKVKVATKLPSWMIETRADMDRFLGAQLKKLGVDCIDYYLLHALGGAPWDKLHRLGVLEFLEQAKADGRIRNAGFSFHGMQEEFSPIVDAYPWEFCQIQFNFLDQQYQAGLEGLRYAASKDIAVVVMEPLRGGSLARVPAPPDVETLWAQAATKRSPADWALRWVWNHPEVTVVLSGMNDESQIEENVATAETADANSLSEDELALIDRVSRKYRELMAVGCTGCGYCMPCPSDVLIPICFEEYNQARMFGGMDQAKFRYAFRMSGELIDAKPHFASQCVACGLCLDKCPQHIPIPEVLARVTAELEDSALQKRVAIARRFFRIEAK